MKHVRGFTLLEMLAALTVLALCAAAALGGFAQGARALQQNQGSDRLSLAARSLFEALAEGPLQPGQQQGIWDGVEWTLQVRREPTAPGPALYRLELSVAAQGRQQVFSSLRVRTQGVRP
ncbi:prepilin-type N-terminal cleavage/methylation domain-containing protein [Pseudomonas sp. DC3200b2]|uniref:prepilin-type N-terminal cleavage/methylation domain-containing protein n=1 Tax=Pseudomonas sp. DC3200b2 TaxID=2804669 RepID=UPI003CF53F25